MRTRLGRAASALAVLALAATGSACVLLSFGWWQRPPTAALAAPAAHSAGSTAIAGVSPPQRLPSAAPVRIDIPVIGVSSPVLRLALAAGARLDGPPPGPHYDDAGWYTGSPAPGSVGPAIVVGHVDSARSGPSVFYRLGGLRLHDAVVIWRADGSQARFTVDSVSRFHKADFPTELVYGDTATAQLRLITCGGPFDRSSGHYLDNTVVFAHLAAAEHRAR